MKRAMTGKRVLALLCALLMTAALLPSVAYGAAVAGKKDDTTTASDSKKEEADAVRKEYNDLQQQINDKRKEMDDLKNELNNIKSQKANTQQQKNLLDQRNAALQEEINLLEQQIDLTNRSISANEALEEQQTELFHKQIRTEEEQGTVSYWSVLFKATSFSDLVSRIDFINEIVRYNQQVISNLRETRQSLAEDKAALEQQTEELTASKKELEGEITESMRLLAEYIKTEEGKQAEYDAIKAEEEALDDLMAAAEAKARELGLNGAWKSLTTPTISYSLITLKSDHHGIRMMLPTGSCKPMARTADSLSTTLSSLPSVHHRPINIFRSKVSPNR